MYDPLLYGRSSTTSECLIEGAAVALQCAPGNLCLQGGKCLTLNTSDRVGR